MLHGPAVRLNARASAYRNYLKTRVTDTSEPGSKTSTTTALNSSAFPARYSYPPVEDYLNFCEIEPDDQITRRVIASLGIAAYDEFLSAHNSVYKYKAQGMLHGLAVRLESRASAYRDHLRNRKTSTTSAI